MRVLHAACAHERGVMRELMHERDQEGVLVQVGIHAYAVRLRVRGVAEIAQLGGARFRNAHLHRIAAQEILDNRYSGSGKPAA